VFDDAAKGHFQALRATPSGMTMRYLRVYAAKCSLNADAGGCWRQIRQATGLTGTAPPNCTALYAHEARRTPKDAARVRADPTVIDYPVTVTIQSGAKTITPASGKAAECRPAD
jgi:hypothetical protein